MEVIGELVRKARERAAFYSLLGVSYDLRHSHDSEVEDTTIYFLLPFGSFLLQSIVFINNHNDILSTPFWEFPVDNG